MSRGTSACVTSCLVVLSLGLAGCSHQPVQITINGVGSGTRAISVPAGTSQLEIGPSCQGTGEMNWSLTPSGVGGGVACGDNVDAVVQMTDVNTDYPRRFSATDETVDVKADGGASWSLIVTAR